MTYKEEITKLIRASYDQGVADAKQEALAALENTVAVMVEAEREACAKVCENSAGIIDAPNAFINGPSNSATRKAQCFADAIRARGETK